VRDAASHDGPMTARQRLTIIATGLGMFMVFLDALIVNVALPDIQSEFGVGEAGAQAVVTSYSVGMAVTIMWSATLADLRGRRRVYLGAAIVFCSASLLCGISPNFTILVIGRAIQGLAAGPITVASLALLSAAFADDNKRTRAVGLWTAVGTIGTAIAPTIGGVLVDEVGWRSIFFVNLPIGVLLVALTLAFVSESSDPSDRTFDYGGQVFFGVAIATFAAGVIAAPRAGWLSFQVLSLFAVAAISIVVFIARERRADDPMMDLGLFVNRVYSMALSTLFVLFFVGYGVLLIVTQFFQNVRGFSAMKAGLLILPFALGMMFMAPLAGRICERIGRRSAILIALGAMVGGLVIIGVGLSVEPWIVSLGLFVAALANSLAVVPLTGLSMSSVTPDKSGMASGIMGTQRAIGSTTGYAVMGSVLAVWVGANLDDELVGTVSDASEREAISNAIVDQANPSAFVAELGPGQPEGVAVPSEQAEILSIADDVFVTGMQASLAVAIGLVVVTLITAKFVLPREQRAV
jgi:EmrB/QacA subfamily drug resistance transporter